MCCLKQSLNYIVNRNKGREWVSICLKIFTYKFVYIKICIYIYMHMLICLYTQGIFLEESKKLVKSSYYSDFYHCSHPLSSRKAVVDKGS